MPGPYVTFSRSNADAVLRYLPHPSGLCVLGVHRPAASFQSAPVIVVAHGGLGYNPGWRAMYSATIGTGKPLALVTALNALGWVVISIDYPACASNTHNDGLNRFLGSWAEMQPLGMWPEQAAYFAHAIQFIKTHWSAEAGSDETVFGADLWGAGNSIDVSTIVTYGNSWGATGWLYTGFQPSGYYPYSPDIGHNLISPYAAKASHRVRGTICVSPQIDLTQFYVDTGYTNVEEGPIYQDDRLQPFMRTESTRKWSTLPMAWKKQSPWWVLQENHSENANFSVFCEFLGTGVDGFDDNLTADDWSPGTVLDDVVGLKAFVDPHYGKLQGQPFKTALESFGSDSAAPIRQSVVRWAGGSGTNGTIASNQYVSKVLQWMSDIGIDPAYLS